MKKSSVKAFFTISLKSSSEIFISIAFWAVTIFLGFILYVTRFLVQTCLNFGYGDKYTLMTGADALFGYKCPGNSSVIHSVSIIKGRPNLELIRNKYKDKVFTFTDGVLDGPSLYSKLKKTVSLKWGFYCWKDENNFELSQHVRLLEDLAPDEVVDENQLLSLLSNLMDKSEFMSDNKPQWEHLVIPNFRYANESSSSVNHFVCVYRIHHAYTDGASIGILTDAVLADKPLKFALDPMKPFPGMHFVKNVLVHVKAILFGPSAFALTLKSAMCEKSPFCVQPYSNKKILNWSETIDMDSLKELKKLSNCSIASILITCITGAMYRFQRTHFPLIDCEDNLNIASLAVMLPYKNRQLQNHFTTFSIPYPFTEENISNRLLKSNSVGKKISESSEPFFNFYVLKFAGYLPKYLQDLLLGLAGTPVMFSNIPGVIEPFSLFGGVMCDAGAWLPLLRVVGMAISTYSYAGKLRICVTSDSHLFTSQAEVGDFFKNIQSDLRDLMKLYGIKCK